MLLIPQSQLASRGSPIIPLILTVLLLLFPAGQALPKPGNPNFHHNIINPTDSTPNFHHNILNNNPGGADGPGGTSGRKTPDSSGKGDAPDSVSTANDEPSSGNSGADTAIHPAHHHVGVPAHDPSEKDGDSVMSDADSVGNPASSKRLSLEAEARIHQFVHDRYPWTFKRGIIIPSPHLGKTEVNNRMVNQNRKGRGSGATTYVSIDQMLETLPREQRMPRSGPWTQAGPMVEAILTTPGIQSVTFLGYSVKEGKKEIGRAFRKGSEGGLSGLRKNKDIKKMAFYPIDGPSLDASRVGRDGSRGFSASKGAHGDLSGWFIPRTAMSAVSHKPKHSAGRSSGSESGGDSSGSEGSGVPDMMVTAPDGKHQHAPKIGNEGGVGDEHGAIEQERTAARQGGS